MLVFEAEKLEILINDNEVHTIWKNEADYIIKNMPKPAVGKMILIRRCDWLPEWAR